jgi:hypothetical protein
MKTHIQAFTIEEALNGTYYRSIKRGRFNDGTIVEAVKRDDVYLQNSTAYAVRVRPDRGSDFWATIAIVEE